MLSMICSSHQKLRHGKLQAQQDQAGDQTDLHMGITWAYCVSEDRGNATLFSTAAVL